MESESPNSYVAKEGDCYDSEVSCLMRVGRDSDWLRLFENMEVPFAYTCYLVTLDCNTTYSPFKLLNDRFLNKPVALSIFLKAYI